MKSDDGHSVSNETRQTGEARALPRQPLHPKLGSPASSGPAPAASPWPAGSPTSRPTLRLQLTSYWVRGPGAFSRGSS